MMADQKGPDFPLDVLESKEEQQVGIQCYISEGGAIPAVTKYLLTDFIVNEINPQGKVVTLSSKPDPNSYQPA